MDRVKLVALLLTLVACSHHDATTDDDGGIREDGADPSDDGGRPGDDSGGPVDAGVDVDAGPPSSDAGPDTTKLSMQGVYGDFASRSIPSDAITYGVRWDLWADGATKRRWILLPPGTQIDNTDQEHWRFPVGTRLVKEFTRDGVIVETRIVETLATGVDLRTYVWNTAQTDGTLMVDGAFNVAGTPHDAPTAHECMKCHQGEPGGALGVSAVQLPPTMLAALSAAGKLKVAIASGTAFGPTGTATEVAALGYLHANCGHCHAPGAYASTVNNQWLRLDAAAKPATSEPGYLSTVGVTVQGNGEGAGKRIDPGNPMNSAILRRMAIRGNSGQMPLLATELVHPAGISTVTDWVSSMTP